MTDRPNNQDAGIRESEHPSDDELSAYLNGDHVDLAARRRLDAHLARCAECRERLSELRAVVQLLRGLEHPVPKRSFRLDPSQVRAPEPEPVRIDPWIVRIQPAMRRLTAIAAVLLVLLVTADVLAHRDSSVSSSRDVSTTSSASRALDSTSVMSVGAAESAPESTSAAAAEVPAATAASGGASTSAGSAGGGSVAESTASSAETTSEAPISDSARSSEAVTPAASAAALSAQESEARGPVQTEASEAPNAATHGGRSYWRLVELAVGVVVIWLLFLTIVLPRMLRQRRS